MKNELFKHIFLDLSKNKDIVLEEDLKKLETEGYNTHNAYLVPKSFNGRFEVVAMTFKSILENSNIGKKLDVCDSLYIELHGLISSILYLINSSSYQKHKYFDFDKLEIDRKLKRKRRIKRRSDV